MQEAAKIPGLDLKAVNNAGQNAMHLAVRSNSPAIIFIRPLNLTFALDINPNTQDDAGRNAFWHADNSNNVSLRVALRAALTAPVQPLDVAVQEDKHQPPAPR